MTEKVWKVAERKIMTILGGKRVPVTGRQRGDAPDGVSEEMPWLGIEIKHRKDVPEWIRTAMDQARAASSDDQLPIAVIHRESSPYTDSLVVVNIMDFVDWFGKIKP